MAGACLGAHGGQLGCAREAWKLCTAERKMQGSFGLEGKEMEQT